MKRYGFVLVLFSALLALAGCGNVARRTPEQAVLTISDVHARAYEAPDGQAIMEVKGTIVSGCNRAVEVDELPRVLQDDKEMDTTYQFSSKKAEELAAWDELAFTATMAFDSQTEHEWRFEAAENTVVEGLDESARMVEALHAFQEQKTVAAKADEGYESPGEDYTLQEVVVLARHNIRAPLSASGSALAQATPYAWHDWTAEASGLTLRGGALETIMGQYVRTWLEHEGLFEPNYQPAQGEVRIYANSKQRTMATARCFASGLLPVADVTVETHAAYDEMDGVFHPCLTFVSDAYREAVLAQIAGIRGVRDVSDAARGLDGAFALIEDVIGYKDSPGYASGELGELVNNDTALTLELGKEPAMEGSLKTGCQLSDALVLQYFEEPDDLKAGFGQRLTLDQWRIISSVKDVYNQVLFGAPLVACNVAHPLLVEIGRELDTPARKFTFLCGHDSNVLSVLTALKAQDYELPDTIESTPIGCMLTFEKWADAEGQLYGRVRLIYQSVDQLRNVTLLENGEAPCAVAMALDGLEQNEDGLYAYDDLRGRIEDAIGEYYQIRATYAEDSDAGEGAPVDGAAEEEELPAAA